MTDWPLGCVLPGDPPALQFVRRFAHPIEKVWTADGAASVVDTDPFPLEARYVEVVARTADA